MLQIIQLICYLVGLVQTCKEYYHASVLKSGMEIMTPKMSGQVTFRLSAFIGISRWGNCNRYYVMIKQNTGKLGLLLIN